ncbi:MAG: hypothetical protein IJC02_11255 [Lachnospiraceae bacterium]|nr:hypothetical protein [Tyzzerella sp.]MBQ3165087.1 hypothetical protein [Lachnospiraceae bacterium]
MGTNKIEIPVITMENGAIKSYIRTTPFVDKSGMFEDFNFKLLVIDNIIDKAPSFYEKYEELRKKSFKVYRDIDEFGLVEEIVEFFENLQLTQEELDKVTEINFISDYTHFCICPNWDGEDESFDVTSIVGCELLKNVKKVWYGGYMCKAELVEELKRIYKID